MRLWDISDYQDLKADGFESNFNYFKNLIESLFKLQMNPAMAKSIAKSLKISTKLFWKKLSDDYKYFLEKYAVINGISRTELLYAIMFPDILSYFMVKAGKMNFRNIPDIFLGCTTSLLKSDENSTMHCRNLDYFGGSFWTAQHTIMTYRLANVVPSVNITTWGLPVIGITAVNEAGISQSVHMLFTQDVSLKGSFIMDLAYQVITKAECIEDVKKILKKRRTVSGWTIINYSHRENKGVISEISAKDIDFIEIDKPVFHYNNFYISEKLKKSEFYPSYIWIQNNHYRNKRLYELTKNKDIFNENDAVKLISDNNDYFLKDNDIFGHTVANSFTVSSTVIDFNKDCILVGDNPPPASIGVFKKYNLTDLFKGKLEEVGRNKTNHDEETYRIYELVVKVMDNLYSGKGYYSSLELINKSDLEIENSYFLQLLKSVLLIKVEDYIGAKKILKRIIESNKLDTYRNGNVKLLLGMIYDVIGERGKAIKIYKEILAQNSFFDLLDYAWKFYNKRCCKSKLQKIVPNFFLSFYLLV
ncbi:hypothetical protein DEFDS_0224 [Deferribacter desulfuricans SSM1]|uniref:Peptidase C45 hydrolase domain-containing protein n=1 Tax=Deferribacter desulfuricans (strain DSM 14783 / JCM 11476 / NBRC 101012 / SSM1) TaxID=639282 RepID=D3PAW2_DEFDS|nr:carcinine hydrolase/isopenicillin-N N-acyltransferase family protein [Deferribacter desulfuricans]BAI79735.1 hypothetical protein DEFDS_0224 [Deferribacter desulfuricans SSM1]